MMKLSKYFCIIILYDMPIFSLKTNTVSVSTGLFITPEALNHPEEQVNAQTKQHLQAHYCSC